MAYWFTDKDPVTDATLQGMNGMQGIPDQIKCVRDALKVNPSDVDFDDVRSIPDVWYIHRIFDMMLLRPIGNDGMYQQYAQTVQRHWRAILAVVMIGNRFGVEVHNQTIDINDIGNISNDHPNAKNIMQAAFDARPADTIWQSPLFDNNAIKIYYIRDVNGLQLPIAISSATTYLVPAADAWKNLIRVYGPDQIPWLRNKNEENPNLPVIPRVLDPKTDGVLKYEDKQALLHEINNVLNAIAIGNANLVNPAMAAVVTGVFQNYANGLPGVPDMQSLLLDTLYYTVSQGEKPKPDADNVNFGSVDPQYCIVSNPNGNIFTYFYIPMPITPFGLSMLRDGKAAYSIANNTKATANSPSVTITITDRINGVSHQKVYDDINRNVREMPKMNIGIAAVWPRQEISDWRAYYVFQHEQGCTMSAGEIRRDEPIYTVEPVDACIGNPYTVKTASFTGISTADDDTLTYKAYDKRPEYWTVYRKHLMQNTSEAIGYVRMRNDVSFNKATPQVFEAAIDFGTSSTMLYGQVAGQGVPRPISGENFWAGAISNPDDADKLKILLRYFIPAYSGADNGVPLQSILARPTMETAGRPSLQGSWIFFRQLAAAGMANFDQTNARISILSDLKWQWFGTADTAAFLQEALYFVALEARAKGCGVLDLHVSYPGAMRENNQANYVQMMLTLATTMQAQTGVTLTVDAGQPIVHEITESEAVARNIQANNQQSTQFCSVDIGGGTSDIFLFINQADPSTPDGIEWKGWESSVKIGARAILLDSFVKNKKLLGTLINPSGSSMDALTNACPQIKNWIDNPNISAEDCKANIEFLLGFVFKDGAGMQLNAGELLCNCATQPNNIRDSLLIKLRERIAFNIGAIMYYAGMLTRETDTMIDQLVLVFAGNGSKVIKWMTDDNKAAGNFIKRMYGAGTGTDKLPKSVSFASNPKHEVALGSMQKALAIAPGKHETVVIQGEKMQVRDTATGKTEDRSAHAPIIAVFQENSTYIVDNGEIKRFLKAFREGAVRDLQLPLNNGAYADEQIESRGFTLAVSEQVKALMQGQMKDVKPFFFMGVSVLDEWNS